MMLLEEIIVGVVGGLLIGGLIFGVIAFVIKLMGSWLD